MSDPAIKDKEPALKRASTGVAYRTAGTGVPLFLLHGGSGSWTHWIRNVNPLSSHFAVYALDLPGYGQSTAPSLDIPIKDYIAIVTETVSEIAGPSPLGLSGFSFGGFLAAGVAATLGSQVSGVSLIGPAGFARPEGRNLGLESRRRLEKRLGRSASEIEIQEMHRGNLAKLMIYKEELIDDLAIATQMSNVSQMRFDSRPLSWSGQMADYLGALSSPVIFISGDHDRSAHPSVENRFQQCRATCPNIRLQIIPDCGHWAQYEKPDTVNRMLIDFHRPTG